MADLKCHSIAGAILGFFRKVFSRAPILATQCS